MPESTGRSDPARSLALLWAPRQKPTRGRQSTLNIDQIVDAAIQIADERGIDAVTMRGIADRLNVGAMSLYRHVPGKGELTDLMMDTIMGEQYIDFAAEEGWRNQLAAYANNALKRRLRHPWILNVPHARAVQGPNWVTVLDAVSSIVDGIGLSDWEMAAVVELVTGYVDHVARNQFDIAATYADTGVDQAPWWEGGAPLFTQWMHKGRFPVHERMTKVWSDSPDPPDTFAFGLDRVLDGIELLVNARTADRHDE